MKIAVLGASGRTGVHVAEQGLARGHRVRTVVRDPAKLTSLLAPEVSAAIEVVTADVRDPADLAHALDGVDAVASCLGWPHGAKVDDVLEAGARACVEAMAKVDIHRLVAISAAGLPAGGDDPINRYLAKPILQRVLRGLYADTAAMEDVLREGDLDWTVIRPPMLTDRPAKGAYVQRRDGGVRWRWSIPRRDLATAVLDALEDDTSIRATLSVAA